MTEVLRHYYYTVATLHGLQLFFHNLWQDGQAPYVLEARATKGSYDSVNMWVVTQTALHAFLDAVPRAPRVRLTAGGKSNTSQE